MKIIGLIKSESGEASFEQIFSSESCRNWKNDETVCNGVIVRPRSAQCAYCEVSLDTLGKKFKDPEKRLIGFRVLRYDV